MTTTRMTLGTMVMALATAVPAAAQTGMPTYPTTGRNANLVPSVLPNGMPEPTGTSERTPPPDYGLRNRFPAPPERPTAMPRYGVRQAGGDEPQPAVVPAPSTNLQNMTMPIPPGGAGTAPDPVSTLSTAGQSPVPNGAYASPWYSDGCCGPTGKNGHVNYELYGYSGPGIITGGSKLAGHMHTGWEVAAGGRSLFFNQAGDAAWIVDLGMSYNYNRGNVDMVNVFVRQPNTTNPLTGASELAPDIFQPVRIRGLHRTAFNFSAGRDWWLWGPGNTGYEGGWNLRVGADIGGRWGTAHVDMVPNDDASLYSRRQKVFHGITASAHADIEAPFGGWIWMAGLKVQYGIDYMDIIPPHSSDVQFVNILVTTGIRF